MVNRSRHRAVASTIAAALLLAAIAGCDRAVPQAPAKAAAQQPGTAASAVANAIAPGVAPRARSPLRVVVMDPLAEPLSCACVPGLGQRRYDLLGKYLSKELHRPVEVIFEESLGLAMRRAESDVDLVIGKRSMVLFDAKTTQTEVRAIAQLTNNEGRTDLTGLIVVRKDDPAKSVADLRDRRIVLGPVEEAEVHGAARQLIQEVALNPVGDMFATAGSIEAGVFAVSDQEADATVISQFLPPLLEGCGKVKPGALRVVGETAGVPFVEVFATSRVDTDNEEQIVAALASVADDENLLKLLESKRGFLPIDWPDWRGRDRDGVSGYIPANLPDRPDIAWTAKVTGPALGGIAVSLRHVVVPDKDAELTKDIFRCFDAFTGQPLWTVEYAADRDIEYTNAPRATPVIHNGYVYLQGAVGDLTCVRLTTGKTLWSRNLAADFAADLLNWGYSSPPLVVDDKLIVMPGAENASIAALHPKTGKVIWQTPGHAASYSALLAGTFSGVRQIVGYDVAGLAGWDAATGKRLWEVIPPGQSDFNVGTPVILGNRILVATENNGTRLYEFDEAGKLKPEPVAENQDLAPDTCSPVAVDGRVICSAYGELFCLDLEAGLNTVWSEANDFYFDHTNIIAGNGRALVWNTAGDLLLVDTRGDQYRLISHVRPFDGKKVESMSHPALVAGRLYIRDKNELKCLKLPGF